MQGTSTGHEDAEGMASVGVRLTAQLGAPPHEFIGEVERWLVRYEVFD